MLVVLLTVVELSRQIHRLRVGLQEQSKLLVNLPSLLSSPSLFLSPSHWLAYQQTIFQTLCHRLRKCKSKNLRSCPTQNWCKVLEKRIHIVSGVVSRDNSVRVVKASPLLFLSLCLSQLPALCTETIIFFSLLLLTNSPSSQSIWCSDSYFECTRGAPLCLDIATTVQEVRSRDEQRQSSVAKLCDMKKKLASLE